MDAAHIAVGTGDAERLREIILDLEQSRRREAEMRRQSDALIQGMQALVGSDDLRDAFRSLLAVFKDAIHFDEALVLSATPRGHDLTTAIATNPLFENLTAPIDGPLKRAQTGQTVILNDAAALGAAWSLPPEARNALQSAVLAPLSSQDGSAVLVCAKRKTNFFGKEHRRLLTRLTPLACQALFQLEQREKLADGIVRIGALLDSAPHSIITIDADLSIGEMMSRSAAQIFQRPVSEIAGAAAPGLLTETFAFAGDDAAKMIEVLELSLGEQRLNWELNAAHLPSEAVMNGAERRICELIWTPMIAADGETVGSVLMSIRDVTRERALAEQIAAHDRQHAAVLDAFDQLSRAPRTQLERFFAEARQLSARIDAVLQDHMADPQRALAPLHTLKGGARLINFSDLAEALHQVEDHILNSPSPAEVRDAWRTASAQLQPLQDVFRDFFGADETAPETQAIASLLEPLIADARQRLRAVNADLRVVIDDNLGPTSPQCADALQGALRHLITNMVDHSIRPALALTRNQSATIWVKARMADGRASLKLTDDGFGFDTRAIAERARARGLEIAPEAPLTVVFDPGFSTAQEVSITSGRGVGMAAVLESMREIGGAIRIEDTNRRGSLIKLSWPQTK